MRFKNIDGKKKPGWFQAKIMLGKNYQPKIFFFSQKYFSQNKISSQKYLEKFVKLAPEKNCFWFEKNFWLKKFLLKKIFG